MALPSTGAISMNDVRTELGKTGTISLNDSDVRNLASKTSGTISMGDLRGKQNSITVSNELISSFNTKPSGAKIDYSGSVSIPSNVISGTITVKVSFSASRYLSNVYFDNNTPNFKISSYTLTPSNTSCSFNVVGGQTFSFSSLNHVKSGIGVGVYNVYSHNVTIYFSGKKQPT